MKKLVLATHNTKGVIDLASIMVGVVVSSIVAGVLSVSLLTIVPGIRDDSAKQQVEGIRTAQNNFQATTGVFGSAEALLNGGYLQGSSKATVSLVSSGQCYIASVVSDTGKSFYITSNDLAVTELPSGAVAPTTITCTAPVGVAANTIPPFFSNLRFGSLIDTNYAVNIDSTGHLWAWGTNDKGQLGDGTVANKTTPVAITPNKTYKQVDAGTATTIALDTDGKLWTWGENSFGQLGDNTAVNKSVPTAINTASTYVMVKAGNGYNLALDTDGKLWAWGLNSSGQLGDNTIVNKSIPTAITPTKRYTTIETGFNTSYALDTNRNLWAWGNNTYGQIGDGTSSATVFKMVPTVITPTIKYKQIEAGEGFAVALDSTDHLFTWGLNSVSQLGDGTTANKLVPTAITTTITYSSIRVAKAATLALTTEGKLWAWGQNSGYQLGLGDLTTRTVPTAVTPSATYASITINASTSGAIDTSGSMWIWGYNNVGQFGNGTTSNKAVPTKVTVIPTGYKN